MQKPLLEYAEKEREERMIMNNTKQKVKDVLSQFKEYLQTSEAKEHLETMGKEKIEVQEIVKKLSGMNNKSPEFTEWVSYGLLPYSKTKVAKRISLFPSFMNIKLLFKDYSSSDEEWNLLANKIFDLCKNFQKDSKKLPELIENFTKDKYSRRLQCGSITPIL